MIVEMQKWMKAYRDAMLALFGSRVLFIGLQGSYARGEADEGSDIDVVLILDGLSMNDLREYRAALAGLPDRDRVCGFVCGRAELEGWQRADLFQFYYDTLPCFGALDRLVSPPGARDARAAVLSGACALYHACSHLYLHHPDWEELAGLYKTAFFILQAKRFCETGEYVKSRAALEPRLEGKDLAVLRRARLLREPCASRSELDASVETMLDWASGLIVAYRENFF